MTDQYETDGPGGSLHTGGNVLNYLGGALLTGVSLWWVAVHSGPQQSSVIIHVTEPDVTVSVDDRVFRVGAAHSIPITCELPPGEHLMRMTRGRTLLYSESFLLRKGEERVLTAWQNRAKPEVNQATGAPRHQVMRGVARFPSWVRRSVDPGA